MDGGKNLFANNPLARIRLNRDNIYNIEHQTDGNMDTLSISTKVVAEFVKKEDDYLINEIIKFAKSEGVSTLYLIDKEFVLTAFRNEIERRKKEQ